MNKLKIISSGQKFAFCMVATSPLRSEAKDSAEMVSQLLFGEPIHVKQIQENWIEVETYFDGYSGWMDRKHVLAISEKEMRKWLNDLQYSQFSNKGILTQWVNQLLTPGSFIGIESNFSIGDFSFSTPELAMRDVSSAFEIAQKFLNTPYLWGGKSISGIDCSGLVQTVLRLKSINIPRDAFQQQEMGDDVEFGNIKTDDIAFFSNNDGKIIHVGILNQHGKIIHASGRVRIDKLTQEGIWNEDFEKLTHSLASIKRLF
jgi:gamma-D-glutamyl-L-lysine dipeptidyl-peptidase